MAAATKSSELACREEMFTMASAHFDWRAETSDSVIRAVDTVAEECLRRRTFAGRERKGRRGAKDSIVVRGVRSCMMLAVQCVKLLQRKWGSVAKGDIKGAMVWHIDSRKEHACPHKSYAWCAPPKYCPSPIHAPRPPLSPTSRSRRSTCYQICQD